MSIAMAGEDLAWIYIRSHYGKRVAERSQVPLIQHIEEGVRIMVSLGASEFAITAYVLHPLVQADDDLREHSYLLRFFDPEVVMLVMEYRNQANAWLSEKVWDNGVYSSSGKLVVPDYRQEGQPSPGPLQGVRDMLIADKVQNYKDFVTHHSKTHERAKELEIYFKEWLRVLGVDDDEYRRLCLVAEGK